MHTYRAGVAWEAADGVGTAGYTTYSRDHDITFEGKPPIPGSADQAFRGDPDRYNPEELLIYCRWLDQEKKLYFRMLDTLYAKSLFTQQQAMNIRLLSQMPIHLNAAASMAQYELLMGLCGK